MRLRGYGNAIVPQAAALFIKAFDKTVNTYREAMQTYEQPDDPWDENALTMHELNAFDFNVEAARTTLAELTGGHKDD